MKVKVEFFNPFDQNGVEHTEKLDYEEEKYFKKYTEIKKIKNPEYSNIKSQSELEIAEVQNFHWHWVNVNLFWPNPIVKVTFIGEQGIVETQFAFTRQEINEYTNSENKNKGHKRTSPLKSFLPIVVYEIQNNISNNSLLN